MSNPVILKLLAPRIIQFMGGARKAADGGFTLTPADDQIELSAAQVQQIKDSPQQLAYLKGLIKDDAILDVFKSFSDGPVINMPPARAPVAIAPVVTPPAVITLPENLQALSDAEAIALVQKQRDLGLLTKWFQAEQRESVKQAINEHGSAVAAGR